MNKLDRQKFESIRTNDEIWYTDTSGCQCQGVVVGWRNHEGLPALLVGQHGDRIVPLAQVLSRSRNGGDHKEWPKLVQQSGAETP